MVEVCEGAPVAVSIATHTLNPDSVLWKFTPHVMYDCVLRPRLPERQRQICTRPASRCCVVLFCSDDFNESMIDMLPIRYSHTQTRLAHVSAPLTDKDCQCPGLHPAEPSNFLPNVTGNLVLRETLSAQQVDPRIAAHVVSKPASSATTGRLVHAAARRQASWGDISSVQPSHKT